MFPCPKKRFDQARNDHITYKKTAFHFVKQTSFKKVIEKTNCVLQKKKMILKVLYLNSTNRNFISPLKVPEVLRN